MKIDWTKVRVNPAECDTELGLYFVSGCGLRSTRPSVGSVSHPPGSLGHGRDWTDEGTGGRHAGGVLLLWHGSHGEHVHRKGDIMKFIGGMIALAIVGLIFYVGFIVIRWLWRMHQ